MQTNTQTVDPIKYVIEEADATYERLLGKYFEYLKTLTAGSTFEVLFFSSNEFNVFDRRMHYCRTRVKVKSVNADAEYLGKIVIETEPFGELGVTFIYLNRVSKRMELSYFNQSAREIETMVADKNFFILDASVTKYVHLDGVMDFLNQFMGSHRSNVKYIMKSAAYRYIPNTRRGFIDHLIGNNYVEAVGKLFDKDVSAMSVVDTLAMFEYKVGLRQPGDTVHLMFASNPSNERESFSVVKATFVEKGMDFGEPFDKFSFTEGSDVKYIHVRARGQNAESHPLQVGIVCEYIEVGKDAKGKHTTGRGVSVDGLENLVVIPETKVETAKQAVGLLNHLAKKPKFDEHFDEMPTTFTHKLEIPQWKMFEQERAQLIKECMGMAPQPFSQLWVEQNPPKRHQGQV